MAEKGAHFCVNSMHEVLISVELKEFLIHSLYTSENIYTHYKQPTEEDKIAAFNAFLIKLTTPPNYTSLLINTTLTSPNNAITDLQHILKEDDKIYQLAKFCTCSVIPEAIMRLNTLNSTSLPMTNTEHEVVIDHDCGMSVLRGADVFTPGVLGISCAARIGDSVSVFCDVGGDFNRGTILTQTYHNKYKLIFVGNGLLQVDRNIFKDSEINVKGVGIRMTEPLYSSPSLNGVMINEIYPQNIPSMLATNALEPKPGDVILDMCAAPGGKTLHISVRIQNKGTVIALDNSQRKVNELQVTLSKFKITCVSTYKFDATKSYYKDDQMLPDTTVLPSMPPYLNNSFDKILVDVPCSGLGRRPQYRIKLSLSEVKSYPAYQRKFLEAAINLVKPGGTIVYSTCTINPNENERNTAWVVKKFPNIQLIDAGIPGEHGIIGCGLQEEECKKVRRFGPNLFSKVCETEDCYKDTNCFYIAKYVKIY